MDWSKYPLDKLIYFVAEIIPGFVALLIFQLAAPGSFHWFFVAAFLGYNTKIILILLVSFVVGHTMTSLVGALLGAVGGAFGAVQFQPSHSYNNAPWRDPSWRRALKKQLGEQAPNDSRLVTQEIFDMERKMVELLPPEQRLAKSATSALLDKLKTEKDDTEWAEWYNHYHKIVIKPDDKDVVFHVRRGVNFSLETTALYTLICAVLVPDLRHWWCLAPALLWATSLAASEYWGWQQHSDKWSTLHMQIRYLSQPQVG